MSKLEKKSLRFFQISDLIRGQGKIQKSFKSTTFYYIIFASSSQTNAGDNVFHRPFEIEKNNLDAWEQGIILAHRSVCYNEKEIVLCHL